MNVLFDDAGHLTEITLAMLGSGHLSDDDLLLAADHLSGCEKCALRLSERVEATELAPSPPGFAEQTTQRIADAEQQKRKTTISFVFFSLRVAAAVCAALIIVFSSSLRNFAESPHLPDQATAPHFGLADTINSGLQQFSLKVLSVEDFYDKKKK
jgi:anti-sigma factor RsiW